MQTIDARISVPKMVAPNGEFWSDSAPSDGDGHLSPASIQQTAFNDGREIGEDVRRVVLFKCKQDADPQEFAAALTHLSSLNLRMTEMSSWWLEVNPGPEGMWDAALIADFADVETLRQYESHPQHVEAATAVAAVSEFAVFDSAN